jgi:hypothetical protein
MALKEKLAAAIEDLTTLEVVTLTNKTNTPINMNQDTAGIFKAVKESLNQSNLVGYSRFELDGDSVNFVSQDESLASLVEEHKVMVSAAQEARKTLFDSVFKAAKEGVSGLLK